MQKTLFDFVINITHWVSLSMKCSKFSSDSCIILFVMIPYDLIQLHPFLMKSITFLTLNYVWHKRQVWGGGVPLASHFNGKMKCLQFIRPLFLVHGVIASWPSSTIYALQNVNTNNWSENCPYLRNNLGVCQVCREITAEGLLITSWGSSAAEGGYQISPRRLFHVQTWQKAQIIPIIIYWASYVSMF